ncbi:MAG: glycosyltransferase family 2 protein [Acidimicrobiales bacterium]
MEDLPKCSIIIPLYNRVDLTRSCLESLVEHTPPSTYEVVLVDNASTDETGALLSQLDGDVVIIRNETNQGFAIACNQGAAAASSDLLLFLNNDTQLLPGWIEPLLRATVEQPQVGAVGAKLIYPDGTIQHGGVSIIQNRIGGLFGGWHDHVGKPASWPDANVAKFRNAVTGALMLVRRNAFEQVGGFDTRYWNGNEDVDLCLALREAGWQVLYEPASTVIHYESQSGPERHISENENNVLLRDRWNDVVLPDIVLMHGRDLAAIGGFPHLARRQRKKRTGSARR